MSEIIQLSAAIEKVASRVPAAADSAIRTDAIYLLFTTVDETLAAARVGAAFASAMAVPLTVIHLRAVPYPLAVDAPAGVSPVETERFVERLRAEGIDVRLRVFLCRSPRRVVPVAFRQRSLVVVGGWRSWWPTRAERWRRALEAAGHLVVFVDPRALEAGPAREEEGTHA